MTRRRARADSLLMEFVWRLPRRVIAWALIRAWAHATSGPWSDEEAPAVTMHEVVKRWDLPHTASLGDGSPSWLRRLIHPNRAREAMELQAALVWQLEKVNAHLRPEEWLSMEELDTIASEQPVSAIQVAQYMRTRLAAGASLAQVLRELREPPPATVEDVADELAGSAGS